MTKELITTPKIPITKIDNIILPDGKVLEADGKHSGKYRFEFNPVRAGGVEFVCGDVSNLKKKPKQ